jgi:hypothetical protein
MQSIGEKSCVELLSCKRWTIYLLDTELQKLQLSLKLSLSSRSATSHNRSLQRDPIPRLRQTLLLRIRPRDASDLPCVCCRVQHCTNDVAVGFW